MRGTFFNSPFSIPLRLVLLTFVAGCLTIESGVRGQEQGVMRYRRFVKTDLR
jgi:hypothetical protein